MILIKNWKNRHIFRAGIYDCMQFSKDSNENGESLWVSQVAAVVAKF